LQNRSFWRAKDSEQWRRHWALDENSLLNEQEIFSAEQEILAQKQGILPGKTEIATG